MTKLKNSLAGIFPGLALLSQPGQSLRHESSKAELTERQQRLQAVALAAVAKMQGNGSSVIPIPTGLAENLIRSVVPQLSDDQIEQFAFELFEQVQWVLNGDN